MARGSGAGAGLSVQVWHSPQKEQWEAFEQRPTSGRQPTCHVFSSGNSSQPLLLLWHCQAGDLGDGGAARDL